ncbi:MAG: glycoside hydrolase family 38 N-terminal domain-containing protein [Armatimonadota bacterium]
MADAKIEPRRKCFLVCNAHIDPVWLWPWEDGMVEAISTFRVAADFCDQYPDFVFNHNEALLYEWVERNDPELFARMLELVKSGRWHIAGGAYLQPDLIGTSGESMIRQFLVGKNYFRDKFGIEPTTAYNFDSFGHPQGLIQILVGCGFDSYIFCRPHRSVLPLPVGAFRWRHASGVEVLARRSDDHYLTQGEIGRQMRDGDFPGYYAGEGDFLFLWGIGNHGGGPSHLEYDQLKKLSEQFPEIEFIESTPEDFFNHSLAARGFENLPVVHGDFKPNNEGCYTSMQRIKTRHRRVENLLHLTEKLAAMAWWSGKRDYPSTDLLVAWKDLLFSEFHDSLPGSGIPQVEEDSLSALAHAEEILRRKKAEVIISLLRDEPLAERNETPIFVFNPHSWPLTQEIEIEYCLDRQYANDSVIRRILHHGQEVPAQFEKGQNNLDNPDWGEWRQRAVFTTTIPPLSYQRFDTDYTALPKEQVRRWKSPKLPHGKTKRVHAGEMDVTVNLQTGLIDKIKADGQTVITGPSFCSLVFADTEHSWEGIPVWSDPAGAFRLATPQEAAHIIGSAAVNPHLADGKPPISIIEDGPIRIIIEAIFVYEQSYLVQHYVISKTRSILRLEQTIFWNEHDTALKVELAHRKDLCSVQAERCYSIDDVSRPVLKPGYEQDYQHFLRLADPHGTAFGIISHGTLGYHRLPGMLRLNVLRSPAYGCMHIAPENDRFHNRYIPRHDQGLRHNRFTFVFGEKAATQEALMRAAYEENIPLEAFVYFPTKKDAVSPVLQSFVQVDQSNVLLAAMKKEEDGEGLILRFWEVGGRNTSFSFTVTGQTYSATIGAHRLQTYRVGRDNTLVPTDLLERTL